MELISGRYVRDVQCRIFKKVVLEKQHVLPGQLGSEAVVFPSIIRNYYIAEDKAVQFSSSGGSPSDLNDSLY